jgi:tRNA A-37 threonylcarbamoyl transferase component Bud32
MMAGTKERFSNVREPGLAITAEIKFIGDAVLKKIIWDRQTVKSYNALLNQWYISKNMSLVEHEVYCLKKLEKYNIAPKVLSYDYDSIIMSNVGNIISRDDKIKDFKKQITYILTSLKKEGIKHNDIISRNVCVKKGKIYLIDFQLASYGKVNIEDDFKILYNRKRLDDKKQLEIIYNWYKEK